MNELIYNQRDIPRGKWKYGLFSSSFSGCGWIAVYNVMLLLGQYRKPECIIIYLKKHIPLINGMFGTIIFSISSYLKKIGFRTSILTKRAKFDSCISDGKCAILFYVWIDRFKIGAHYIAVQKVNGVYYGYNTFSDSKGPDLLGTSLNTFLSDRHYFFPILMSVDYK